MRTNEGGKAVWRLAAVLLAASALQGCAGANVLATIDGPFVPPSEREAAQQQSEAAYVAATIAQLAPASSQAEPEAAPVDEAVDPQFVGPLLASAELAPAVVAEPVAEQASALVVPEAFVVSAPTPAEVSPEPLAELPARIDRDFLAPPPVEPAPVPAPVPAPASSEVFGPAVPAAEAPVELAMRLPSAFDYSPPAEPEPELEPVPALVTVPAPAPVVAPAPALPPSASAVTAYAAFHRFALERLAASPAGAGRRSMLLADPASLDPGLQTCGTKPPAVLIDLDPANSLLPLVGGTRGDPLLAALLADLRARGVAIYWITGHAPAAAASIRQRLVASTLDPTGNDPLIVTRFASESKQIRRQTLGQTHCLLAILGDYRGDFDELYDYLLDPAVAEPLEVHVDNGWFLAPLPLG